MRINTIMFDLDGTLLPMDDEKFRDAYLKSINSFIYGNLGEKNFTKYMLYAIEKMQKDKDGSLTNMQKFIRYFNEVSTIKYDIFKRYVDEYYIKEFDRLSCNAEKESLVKMTVSVIKKKGYNMILASNALFPKKAIEVRLKWSGLNAGDFSFIANIDNMHYIKPNLEYYKEILAVNDVNEEACIMVGNDVDEDLIASELGVSTFYLNEYGINKSGVKVNCPQGTYIQFYEWAKSLPDIIKG